MRRDFWKEQIEILMEITRSPDYKFLVSTVEKLNEEHLRMSGVVRKIKEFLRMRKVWSKFSFDSEVERSRRRAQELLIIYLIIVSETRSEFSR